jgi:caffeoyl-CoA O-methyltransferase
MQSSPYCEPARRTSRTGGISPTKPIETGSDILYHGGVIVAGRSRYNPQMNMTPERWDYTCTYLRDVFGRPDAQLAGLAAAASAAGLPQIAVSPDVGRLLMLLTSMTAGRLAIEVGTLGGYSSLWLARGLSTNGKLITIEKDPRHADFAEAQFRSAQLAERIELRRGDALPVLHALAGELEEGSVDLVFVDADKQEYPAYWETVRPLIARGGLFIADNVLGAGNWWIDDEQNASRNAADRLNRLVAEDPDFEAVAVPIREGVLIGRRVR